MVADETVAGQPFHRIREALEKELKPMGLRVVNWAVFLGLDADEKPQLQFAFDVDVDVAFASPESRVIRTEFEDMMAEQHAHELRERSKTAATNLLNIHKGGIFDDPPAE